MEILTNKQLSQAVRQTLKDNGYNTTDFSIRTRDCGYSTSCNITIKNLKIRREEIEGLVAKFESIDRDYASGEILEGGNTYIFVEYDYTLWQEFEKQFYDRFLAEFEHNRAINEANGTPNNLFTLVDDNKKHIHITYATHHDSTIFITVGGTTHHYNANNGYGLAHIWAKYELGHYDYIKEITTADLEKFDDYDRENFEENIKMCKEFNEKYNTNTYKFAYFGNYAIKIA